jgi:hypothetical protein
MTPTQITALRAVCLATPAAAAFFVQDGAAGLKAYLNAPTDPAWIAWRSQVPQDEIMLNGFDWARVDNLSVGKARVWEWLFDNQTKSINPSKLNVRAGIDQVWTGVQADLAVRAAVYVHCKRTATRVEKMLGSGVGTTADPGLMTFEGEVSDLDAALLVFKDDGSIWA